ncbi:MAG: molybdopterin oxidoreductase [SAR202 cluster bacterium]|jgi:molybdopterin-containing oxidoreductase family membrane subunit|nr:molybdopterin oxidoreductase [Chloroflexota bacterium]MDP6422195.1 polysulfide reductase NrfD [SAR202 cluster bacterium]HAL49438.1 molybdopterin oxidoreductase [Dehalococcoidia bacterium]MDP6663486.1 polysulfide reductase NrfD [SAR202 cluster bacterium]MDP6799846.1 polysulfide reductase NrfD [SAR202 cluster bacterium]|tara:strand:- start:2560 stop:3933 length:1374 start_codon:yes stop_codon:yes gene_type:complete
MQQFIRRTDKEINEDLLAGVLGMPKWWLPAVIFLTIVVFAGLGSFGYMMNKGLGVTGLNRPVMWGFFLVNFVFWIGISHAGIMISAILRLTKAEWRRPVTRAAEVMTVFSLMAALHTPLVHVGRPWRELWVFPYDFARGVWPNVRSPFVWDPSAVGTYLIGSSLFVFVALLPDMAVLRDRVKGKISKRIYGVLCLGWRGTPRQWKLQALAGILLSALVLPVFVSVHSIVSWDFAVVIGVEGWHSTIFAPYFIIGAIHSGVSAVAMLMALAVWLWGYEKYLRPDHFDAIGRLLIVVATTWFFFFFLEWVFALYTLESPEIVLRETQITEWPYAPLFIVFLFAAFIIPVPMWLFKRVRRSVKLMFFTTILVNIGMWLERFLIIIPGMIRRQPMSFDWGAYSPSIVEILIVAETFAFVALGMLLFSKFLPLIPLFDIKEGMVLRDEIKVGRRVVPAVIQE